MKPTEKEIRDQLKRILAFDDFVSAPRKTKLLKYLVEQTLKGSAERLKGYSIGIDVFERRDDFDPQLDSIVRVQTGRLRKALELYYLTRGRKDPIRIDLPKGQYTPVFLTNEVSQDQDKIYTKPDVISKNPPVLINPVLDTQNVTSESERIFHFF